MYPLVYHLGVDDYFPNEDFEPHLFEHLAARRAARRPSPVRRLASAVRGAVRGRDDGSPEEACVRPPYRGEPAIRWG
jgi:hypothetical protein